MLMKQFCAPRSYASASHRLFTIVISATAAQVSSEEGNLNTRKLKFSGSKSHNSQVATNTVQMTRDISPWPRAHRKLRSRAHSEKK